MKIDLRKPNLRRVPVGAVVTTSKGFEFELMARDENGGETWLDLTSKLNWFPKEPGAYTHHEAVEKFNLPAKRLPTKEEFEEAEKHGIREVHPDLISDWLWSSSVGPYGTGGAYVFFGFYGGIAYVNRSYSIDAVVCVAGR